jgi:hypothetical protein
LKVKHSLSIIIVLIIAVWVIAGHNSQVINNFLFNNFIFGRDKSEIVTRTFLQWTTTQGEQLKTVFKIPYGYLEQSAAESKDRVALTARYPSKGFVSPLASEYDAVYILVDKNDGSAIGDAIKTSIDNGTLGTRFYRHIITSQKNHYVLGHLSGKYNSSEHLIFDATRGHWVLIYPYGNNGSDLMVGEYGILSDQPMSVYYHYHRGVEPDFSVMYQWVLTFIESMQISSKLQY